VISYLALIYLYYVKLNKAVRTVICVVTLSFIDVIDVGTISILGLRFVFCDVAIISNLALIYLYYVN